MVPCLLSFPKCLHFQCSDRVSGCAGLRSRVCTQCRSIKEESTMGTNPAAPAPGAAAGPQPCPVPNDLQKKVDELEGLSKKQKLTDAKLPLAEINHITGIEDNTESHYMQR